MADAEPDDRTAPTAPEPEVHAELARDMSLLHVTMIGVGAMIGAGIFVLTGLAAGEAGPALVLVFLLNGVVTTLTALSYAELGSCFPEAGGGYLWVKEALPQPSGFLSGWMSWFAHAVACSLYAVAFGAFAVEILQSAGASLVGVVGALPIGATPQESATRLIAILVTMLFTYINFRGAEETGLAETAVTVLKMVVIGLFLGFGLWAIFTDPARAEWTEHFVPFFPRGAGGVITAMGLTFIAFEGYEIIAQCGEEVVDPKRNIPRSIFLSLIIVVPVYMLVAFVALAAISGDGLASWQILGQRGELAMVEAAQEFMPWGKLVFLIGGLFSTMSALNATIYSSSRVSFAMGRDNNFPDLFGRVHPRYRTPQWAIGISGAFVVLMAVGLPIEDIASATDAMFLLLFVLVNVSVINLRRHRPDLDRGFTVPWLPWTPLIATAINLGLAVFLFFYSPRGILVSGGYIAVGVVLYYVYARGKEREARVTPVVLSEVPFAEASDYRILLPISHPDNCESLVDFAARLARFRDGDIVLLNIIRVPAQLPLSAGRRYLESSRRLLARAADRARSEGVPVHSVVRVAHSIPRAILETAEEKGADLIALGWEGPVRRRDRVFGTVLDTILVNAPVDVALARRVPTRRLRRVVVASADAPPLASSLRLAAALHHPEGEAIEVLRLTSSIDQVDALHERIRENVDDVVRDDPHLAADMFDVVVEAHPRGRLVAKLCQAVEGHDLVIMGAPREGLLQRAVFGDVPERVAKAIDARVVLTKEASGPLKSWLQMLLGSRRTSVE